ncbi:MAG: hypothetical protein GY715_19680 [Planctomycetes bacterium]|nr:hypothetical protein [Planctomycetota bacterium]
MAVSPLELWLPILVASVVVFIASFVSWMLLPFHKADFKKLKDEEAFFKTLAAMDAKPGQYMFPSCDDPSRMKDPEFKKQWLAGPHGSVLLCPAAPNFGRNLLLVFLFYVVLSFFVAYLASFVVPADAVFRYVFRVAGTAAVLGYVFGAIPGAIFFGKPLRAAVLDAVDGVVYGVLTGLIFARMWPEAETLLTG